MVAILFSANPSFVTMDDAINHLAEYPRLYWEVGYKVKKENFEFPLLGFIYINGQGVNYKIVIEDIIPFSTDHYKNPSLAEEVKPTKWQEEYKQQVKQKIGKQLTL